MSEDAVDWASLRDAFGPATPIGVHLDRLGSATDRDVSRAAAADLLQRGSDGTAISEVVPLVVRRLLALIEDSSFSWRADALAVLEAFAWQLGAWEAAARRSRRPENFVSQIAWEHETRGLLGGSDVVLACLQSADPEVRSMAYEVWAIAADDPVEATGLLRGLFGNETDGLARACLAQSIVRAASRAGSDEAMAQIVAWVRERRSDPEPAVAARIDDVLREYPDLDDDEPSGAPPAGSRAQFWPAEVI